MRRSLLRVTGVVAATAGAGVVAFVPLSTAPRAGCYGPEWSTPIATPASSAGLPDKLPPQDETFSPLAIVQEILAAPEYPVGSQRYDGIGQETGGVWRSRVFGFLPCTIIAAPLSTKWATKQEVIGNIVEGWPPSFGQVMGPKGVTNLGSLPEAHASARKIFKEALSPKAVLKLQPMIEASLDERVLRWEKFAASGEDVKMQDEIYSFTVDIISRCFLGDYRTEKVLEDIERLIPVLANGVLSLPLRLPWPLNRFPAFSFGRAMSARADLIGSLEDVLRQRRADWESTETMDEVKMTGGVLDELLAMQKQQMDVGGPGERGVSFDDAFIFDNVIFALFAGFDTTSVTLARMLQLLGSAGGKKVAEELVEELNHRTAVDGENTPGGASKSAERSSPGVFGAFPLLEAVVLESSRMYPVVPGAFRRAVRDVHFNGYLIPAGTRISWNVLGGYRSERLYPESKKFCPFRFLNGDKSRYHDGEVEPNGDITTKDLEQPHPPMWGYGKHMCPGRELAKLEILLFLKNFLTTFDYDLVEGQSFKNTLPVNAPRDKLRLVLRLKP